MVLTLSMDLYRTADQTQILNALFFMWIPSIASFPSSISYGESFFLGFLEKYLLKFRCYRTRRWVKVGFGGHGEVDCRWRSSETFQPSTPPRGESENLRSLFQQPYQWGGGRTLDTCILGLGFYLFWGVWESKLTWAFRGHVSREPSYEGGEAISPKET